MKGPTRTIRIKQNSDIFIDDNNLTPNEQDKITEPEDPMTHI